MSLQLYHDNPLLETQQGGQGVKDDEDDEEQESKMMSMMRNKKEKTPLPNHTSLASVHLSNKNMEEVEVFWA